MTLSQIATATKEKDLYLKWTMPPYHYHQISMFLWSLCLTDDTPLVERHSYLNFFRGFLFFCNRYSFIVPTLVQCEKLHEQKSTDWYLSYLPLPIYFLGLCDCNDHVFISSLIEGNKAQNNSLLHGSVRIRSHWSE